MECVFSLYFRSREKSFRSDSTGAWGLSQNCLHPPGQPGHRGTMFRMMVLGGPEGAPHFLDRGTYAAQHGATEKRTAQLKHSGTEL